MISKDKIISLITKEKDQYNLYIQLCSFYQIDPDPIATAKHSSKLEALELVLNQITK